MALKGNATAADFGINTAVVRNKIETFPRRYCRDFYRSICEMGAQHTLHAMGLRAQRPGSKTVLDPLFQMSQKKPPPKT